MDRIGGGNELVLAAVGAMMRMSEEGARGIVVCDGERHLGLTQDAIAEALTRILFLPAPKQDGAASPAGARAEAAVETGAGAICARGKH
ncbi:hypothetical protein WMF31_25630 [Sorangium sp. So ce1036]|uniref:hypothetical protein n=1 Tax=Sorangium sp. So ce1036 TaxID=3133328 RepID=UPI003F0FE54A